jgi:hypothetical protein
MRQAFGNCRMGLPTSGDLFARLPTSADLREGLWKAADVSRLMRARLLTSADMCNSLKMQTQTKENMTELPSLRDSLIGHHQGLDEWHQSYLIVDTSSAQQ